MAEKSPLLSCNATRQELLEHLKSATSSPELFSCFFRKEGDSTVCAACGKPIMAHPNGAAHTAVPVPPPVYTPPPPQAAASPTMGIPVTPLKNDNRRIHYKTNGTGAGFFSMLGGCWHVLRIAHFIYFWGGFIAIWVCLIMGNKYPETPAPPTYYDGSGNQDNNDSMSPAGLAAIQWAVMFVLQAPLFCRSRGYWLASRPANPEGFDEFNTAVVASRAEVQWEIRNSHVRSSVVGGTDYYGNLTISTVHQTIHTHSHSGGFSYASCIDLGSEPIGPYDGKLFYVIQPTRELWFANTATQESYESALARYMIIHSRDNQTSLDEDYSLSSAPGGLSTIRMPEGGALRKKYWLACLLGCGYLFDWHVSKKIQHLYPTIRKAISVV